MEVVHLKGISKASVGISKTRTVQRAYRKIPGLKCSPSLLSMQDGRLGGASDRSTKGVGTESEGMYLFICGQGFPPLSLFQVTETCIRKDKKRASVRSFEIKRLKDQNIILIRPPVKYNTHPKGPDLSSSLLPAAVEPHQRLLYTLDATQAPNYSYLNSPKITAKPSTAVIQHATAAPRPLAQSIRRPGECLIGLEHLNRQHTAQSHAVHTHEPGVARPVGTSHRSPSNNCTYFFLSMPPPSQFSGLRPSHGSLFC